MEAVHPPPPPVAVGGGGAKNSEPWRRRRVKQADWRGRRGEQYLPQDRGGPQHSDYLSLWYLKITPNFTMSLPTHQIGIWGEN